MKKMALLACLKGPKRPKKAQKHFFLSDYSITPLKRFLVTPEIHPGAIFFLFFLVKVQKKTLKIPTLG